MKKFTRKISLFLVISMILTAVFTFPATAAQKVGDKLGDVLNTDIKTYINGRRIPCYNIDGKSVVRIADLRNYGFDVEYDEDTRTATVERNYGKKFTPIKDIENNTKKPGTAAFSYLYTDISAYVNGKRVKSYNTEGYTAIFFSDLGDYGTFSWDGAARESKLTFTPLPINDAIDYFISTLSGTPKGAEEELRTAIKALALNNPVYTPHEVVEMLYNSLQGFRKNPDSAAVLAVYIYDGYVEINQKFLDDILENKPQTLRNLFAHELTHALNISNKAENDYEKMTGKGYLFSDSVKGEDGLWEEIKIHGAVWGGRLTEGLTDIYSFSALGGKYTESTDKYITGYYIPSPFCYPKEQAAAVMFLNAFGRQNVAKAYFGAQEEYDAFEIYCQKLTGITFRELMSLITKTVAWMYTDSYAPDTGVGDVSKEIKKYMDMILEVCEKRVNDPNSPITAAEIDGLIDLSVKIQDKGYMDMYYKTLNDLKKNIKL